MFPILLAQLAQMTLGVVDTVMTGRYRNEDMAAVALAWSVWIPAYLFGIGLITAVTPTVGQLRGAGTGNKTPVINTVRQGMWLAVIVSVPICTLMYLISYRLDLFGMSVSLAEIGGKYLRALTFGILPSFLYIAIRSSLEGFAIVRPAMFASLIALAVNIPFNYAFIFGKIGAPELGGAGAGVATAVTSWAMFLSIFAYAYKVSDIRTALISIGMPHWPTMKKLASVGFPNALAALNEGGLFSVMTLLVAPLGTLSVAGHQVAIIFSSIIFILPLSIGMAATIRTSYAIGTGNTENVRLTARTALWIGESIAVITAILTVVFRYDIAALCNPDPNVVTLAASLLFIDASYQLSDSFQVVSVGILRGYKDTRSIFWITTVCFWIIATPLAWLMGRTELFLSTQSVQGLWYGLVIGLSLAAICYFFRIRTLEQRFEQTSQQQSLS